MSSHDPFMIMTSLSCLCILLIRAAVSADPTTSLYQESDISESITNGELPTGQIPLFQNIELNFKSLKRKREISRLDINGIICESNTIRSSMGNSAERANAWVPSPFDNIGFIELPESPISKTMRYASNELITTYEAQTFDTASIVELYNYNPQKGILMNGRQSAPASSGIQRETFQKFLSSDFGLFTDAPSYQDEDTPCSQSNGVLSFPFDSRTVLLPSPTQDDLSVPETDPCKDDPEHDDSRAVVPVVSNTAFEFVPEPGAGNLEFNIGTKGPARALPRSSSTGKSPRTDSKDSPQSSTEPDNATGSKDEFFNMYFTAPDVKPEIGTKDDDRATTTASKSKSLDLESRGTSSASDQSLIYNVRDVVKNVSSAFSSWINTFAQTAPQLQQNKCGKQGYKKRIIRKFKRKLPTKKLSLTLSEVLSVSPEVTVASTDSKQQVSQPKSIRLPGPDCKTVEKPETEMPATLGEDVPDTDPVLDEPNDVPLHPNVERTYVVLIFAITAFSLIAGFYIAWRLGVSRLRARKFFVWHHMEAA